MARRGPTEHAPAHLFSPGEGNVHFPKFEFSYFVPKPWTTDEDQTLNHSGQLIHSTEYSQS
jgi:hypothetical protein